MNNNSRRDKKHLKRNIIIAVIITIILLVFLFLFLNKPEKHLKCVFPEITLDTVNYTSEMDVYYNKNIARVEGNYTIKNISNDVGQDVESFVNVLKNVYGKNKFNSFLLDFIYDKNNGDNLSIDFKLDYKLLTEQEYNSFFKIYVTNFKYNENKTITEFLEEAKTIGGVCIEE